MVSNFILLRGMISQKTEMHSRVWSSRSQEVQVESVTVGPRLPVIVQLE